MKKIDNVLQEIWQVFKLAPKQIIMKREEKNIKDMNLIREWGMNKNRMRNRLKEYEKSMPSAPLRTKFRILMFLASTQFFEGGVLVV